MSIFSLKVDLVCLYSLKSTIFLNGRGVFITCKFRQLSNRSMDNIKKVSNHFGPPCIYVRHPIHTLIRLLAGRCDKRIRLKFIQMGDFFRTKSRNNLLPDKAVHLIKFCFVRIFIYMEKMVFQSKFRLQRS